MKKYSREYVDRERFTKPRVLKSRDRIPSYVPFVYLLLVVYGSLVPFNYRAVPISEIWSRFLDMPYLMLGVASRADWVANILLYIPMGFLSVAWMGETARSTRGKFLCVLVGFLGCSFVAATIEFLQIFVSPRTVSLNDIIAENLGAIVGIALWYTIGGRLTRLWKAISAGGREAIDAALVLYALLYLALSLFPFDFLVSLSELSWKLTTDHYHAFIGDSSCHDLKRCVVTLIAEIIAVVPLGILIGIRSGGRQSHIFSTALLCGGTFGIIIEVSQFFIASGVSQGASVLTRILGLGLGLWLFPSIRGGLFYALRPFLRISIVCAAVPYFLLVMNLNGWFTQDWVGLEEALFKLDKKMFIPFYYHYFSTETRAVSSLLCNAAMYAPIGFGYWAWCFSLRAFSGSTFIAGLFGGIATALIEIGKLFLSGKHPDFTNILIAAVSAGTVYRIADWIFHTSLQLQRTSLGVLEDDKAKAS